MISYSIIKKSQLEGASRLDAEYYQPEYLEINRILTHSHFNTFSLRDLISRPVVTGTTPKQRVCKEDGSDIKFIKTNTLRDGEIMFEAADCLPVDQSRKLSEPQGGDILVTIIGATYEIVGRSAVVFSDYPKMNINQNIVLIRPIKNISPGYLEAFLRSKFGRLQLWQQSRQTEQVNLNCREVENILIPLAKCEFQEQIDDLIQNARTVKLLSQKYYQQAENLLLEELRLSSFTKATEDEKDLSWIVNLSDVQSANRMDAEYFQPKYEKLISKIKNKNAKMLGNFVEDYSTGYPFKSGNYQEEGIPLIRINNIRKGYIDLSDTAYLSEKDYLLSPKDTAKSGDVVLSMSGTIGMSAIIPDGITKCSINQRILRTTSKNISRDYLVLVLNSIVGSFQLERIGTGGVQTNISYKDIKNILIPELPKLTQQKIADLVQKSHKARKKSKELLEEAKRKVETSIETQSKGDDRFSKLTTS